MKIKRLLALLMSVATMLTMFAACGNKGEDEKETTKAAGETTTAAAEEEKDFDLSKGLSATKVGSYNKNEEATAYEKGARYKTADGKYGFVSADGKDTGAIYTYCEWVSNDYFIVSQVTTVSAVDDYNSGGVVDSSGKVIIPLEYASITKINERYFRADKVTEETEDDEEKLVKAGDSYYKGTWVIYDMETGKTVPGATGTKAYQHSASGAILTYVTDAGDEKKVGPGGKEIPSDATTLADGGYVVSFDNGKAVYGANGTKLFEHTSDKSVYVYYAGVNRYQISEGAEKYFIVNEKGEAITAEFDEMITYAEGLLISNGRVYDYEGNLVLDADYYNIKKDITTGNVWYLDGNDGYAIINKAGTVLYSCKKNDGVSAYSCTFEKDSEDKYYSFADKDYTIEGSYAFAPWLVKCNTEDYSETWITDTISGKKIVEGYNSYDYVSINGTIYIHASNYDSDTVDVYKVS